MSAGDWGGPSAWLGSRGVRGTPRRILVEAILATEVSSHYLPLCSRRVEGRATLSPGLI